MNAQRIWTDRERVVAVEMCRHSFYFFVRWMFLQKNGAKWQRAPHHLLICHTLERVFLGEIIRLVINIPPRYSKSELLAMFIAWTLGQYADSEYIYTSYASMLAEERTAIIRDIVQHPAYLEVFPHVQIRSDRNARGDWGTTAGGVVYAAGDTGTIVGKGAGKVRDRWGGCLAIDDPTKPDEARTQAHRASERYLNTLQSRLNQPMRTPVIVIMQRLIENDLSGWLLGDDQIVDGLTLRNPGGTGERWWHLCMPALNEDGSALWPDKHSAEVLRIMEQASPIIFSGQYRQRPSTAEGNVYKPDQLRIVDAIPHGTDLVRAWDFAASVPEPGRDPDWTVGGLIGKCPDGQYIIADIVRMQGTPDEVKKAVKNTADADGPSVRIHIPQDPGQAGKSQARDFVLHLAGYIVLTDPPSGDKVNRASPFASQINVGNVMMLRAEWNKPLKDELRVFPNGKHDDQSDAIADGFNAFNMGNTGMLEFLQQSAEALAKQNAETEANKAPPGSAMAILEAIQKQALQKNTDLS